MPPLHHTQVEQMTRQLQQMELPTSPTTTGDETMATQADMLDQGMYVHTMLRIYSTEMQFTIIQQIIRLITTML